MKILLLLLAIVVAYIGWREIERSRSGFDEIEWRGQKFKLSQKYIDWEDYRSSSHQLHAGEVPRVEAILVETRVPETFKSHEALIRDMPELRFPGYGMLYDGSGKTSEGAQLVMSEYEIPETGKRRQLVYRAQSDGSFRLVSDTVRNVDR